MNIFNKQEIIQIIISKKTIDNIIYTIIGGKRKSQSDFYVYL